MEIQALADNQMHNGHPVVQGAVVTNEQAPAPAVNLSAGEVHDIADPSLSKRSYKDWAAIDHEATVGRDQETRANLDPSEEQTPRTRSVFITDGDRTREWDAAGSTYEPFDFIGFRATSDRFAAMSEGITRNVRRMRNKPMTINAEATEDTESEIVVSRRANRELFLGFLAVAMLMRSRFYGDLNRDHAPADTHGQQPNRDDLHLAA